jgi:hypothetical protein
LDFNTSNAIETSDKLIHSGESAQSDEFTASSVPTADDQLWNAESGLSIATPVSAAAGAILCSGLLAAGALFLMKRLKKEQATHCAIEYEAEGHGIGVRNSESGDDGSEDWDVHIFEDGIESVFDAPTQVAYRMNPRAFDSDCDESF